MVLHGYSSASLMTARFLSFEFCPKAYVVDSTFVKFSSNFVFVEMFCTV